MGEAVEACQAALKERTRERVPLDWASTQHNLCWALESLGEREPGTQHLLEGVEACQAALKERTRERVPLDWAMTQDYLGHVLLTLGEREPATPYLQDAVTAFDRALRGFQSMGATPYVQNAERDLASARTKLQASQDSNSKQ